MRAEQGTVNSRICRIGIRKMRSDVAECGGTQKGVHHGVQKHIGIGMPQQSLFKRNANTA